MNESYDCIVIGGGPAGSTVGTLLSQHGHRTLIVERAKFPRFHIGESLMPETYWTFKRLGMLEKMKNSHFIKKYSVKFANAQGRESAPFYFDEMNPHECSQTWQVTRSEFDQMMLENAAEHGAEVWQETNVVDIIVAPVERPYGEPPPRSSAAPLPRVTGVVAQRADGQQVRLEAKVVVDATGNVALLSKRFGIRKPDPKLRKAAVFAHYKDVQRDPGPRDEGATLVLHVAEQNGWFWFIPLHDVVSIGVVGDVDYLIRSRGAPEQVLEEEIQRCPTLVPRMARATRVSPVHVLNDFSFNSSRCAGDGWVLVGDAFTFLDPIYSSGVFLALKSGELAADAIHDAFLHNDFSAARLGRWGPDFYAGLQAVRKLVYTYYTRDFSFGRFIRAHPEQKRNLVSLLIGDVYRPEPLTLFETMKKYVELPEPIRLES